MMAYASSRHKLPDENKNELMQENPRRLTYNAPAKKKDTKPHDEIVFECDYIYLKLESS
jgi:hypothetical protein